MTRSRQLRVKIFWHIYYNIKKLASLEPDEIEFEGEYDKADPIDDANLDESINELNRSILEHEELEKRTNGHQRIKLNEPNWNNR